MDVCREGDQDGSMLSNLPISWEVQSPLHRAQTLAFPLILPPQSEESISALTLLGICPVSLSGQHVVVINVMI